MSETVEYKYQKVCKNPSCRKAYPSNARGQRYCNPDCQKKHHASKQASRDKYSSDKDAHKLKAEAHRLAVKVLKYLESKGLLKHVCCDPDCQATEGLEAHHKNLVWVDNTPSNLEWRCKKHHAKEHSRIKNELDEEGILIEEYYEESFYPIVKATNKTR